MIVYTTHYGSVYKRLARVLRRSAVDNCPDAAFVSDVMLVAGQLPYAPKHATDNTGKLEMWNAFAQLADDDLVLLDADMLVLHDLAEVFRDEGDWDMAYTVRPGPRRIQGGAVYLRAGSAARELMAEWTARNRGVLADEPNLDHLIDRYGGVNQAALSMLVDAHGEDGPGLLRPLPCELYNSCKQTWQTFNSETAVVHLTGRLRRQICACRMPPAEDPEWTRPERNIIAAWLYYSR